MGALIMLLVVIARNVREQVDAGQTDEVTKKIVAKTESVDPDRLTAEEANRILEQIQFDAEEAAWYAENFLVSKKHADQDLNEARAALASAEQQTQKYRDELQRLVDLARQYEEAEKMPNARQPDAEFLKQALKHRQEQFEKLEKTLETLREEAAEGEKSYAIIPYRGTNGTFRRPIYIECHENRIIIQPEGVVLNFSDFALGERPDNPMDTMLRVVRQYYAETNQIQRGTEPYPLLIVRPSGVEIFEAAMRSMGNWVKEFGYELVDEDWKVQYPVASAELRDRMDKQLETARTRLLAYQTAMRAQQAGERMSQQYRVDARGAVRPVQNPLGPLPRTGNSRTGDTRPGEHGSRYGSASQATSRTTGPSAAHSGTGYPAAGQTAANHSVAGTSARQVQQPRQAMASGHSTMPTDDDMPESLRRELTGSMHRKNHAPTIQQDNQSYHPYANQYSAGSTSSEQTMAPGPYSIPYPVQAQSPLPQQAQQPGQQLGQQQGQTHRQSQGPSGEQTESGQVSRQTGQAPSHFAVQPQPTADGMPSFAVSATTTPEMNQGFQENHQSMPQASKQKQSKTSPPVPQRQDNWALRNVKPFSAAVKRVVKIRCDADMFVLSPQQGLPRSRVVPISDSVIVATDSLVQTVWEYMATWDAAGEKYHWKPVLLVEVSPGGEQRFEELRWLLRNSGFEIEKASPNQRRR